MERFEGYIHAMTARIVNGSLEIPTKLNNLYSPSGIYFLKADNLNREFITICPEHNLGKLEDYLFESSGYRASPLQADIGANGTHYLKLPEVFLQYLGLSQDSEAVIMHFDNYFTISKQHHQELSEWVMTNYFADI